MNPAISLFLFFFYIECKIQINKVIKWWYLLWMTTAYFLMISTAAPTIFLVIEHCLDFYHYSVPSNPSRRSEWMLKVWADHHYDCAANLIVGDDIYHYYPCHCCLAVSYSYTNVHTRKSDGLGLHVINCCFNPKFYASGPLHAFRNHG